MFFAVIDRIILVLAVVSIGTLAFYIFVNESDRKFLVADVLKVNIGMYFSVLVVQISFFIGYLIYNRKMNFLITRNNQI